MIRFESISKKFGDRQVVKHVDLTIESGGFVSLMGKSGSGKTTLLSMIAGLTKPDNGRIFVGDQEVTSLNEEGSAGFRLQHVGIVFQDFKLIPSLSVRDNMYIALHPRVDLSKADKNRRVNEMIEAVELGEIADQQANKLSGGEQQRVSIGRSLVKYPSIVLADEPTGNLDSQTALNIMKLFKKMHRQFNSLFLIVTHDQDIADQTDKTFYIKDGVVELATP